KGITLLLINLDNTTRVEVNLSLNNTLRVHKLISGHHHHWHKGNKPRGSMIDDINSREEYHLTAKNRNLHSQVMMLNGKELTVDANDAIPPLEPVHVNSSEPISVAPYSIVFAHLPHLTLYACSN
ncbi:heparanase-like protein 3, partial [Tanacetum coccineum]